MRGFTELRSPPSEADFVTACREGGLDLKAAYCLLRWKDPHADSYRCGLAIDVILALCKQHGDGVGQTKYGQSVPLAALAGRSMDIDGRAVQSNRVQY